MLTPLSKVFAVPGSSDRLSAMEGLRAYAVVAVFLVHYVASLSRIFGNGLVEFNPFTDSGVKEWFFLFLRSSHYGVDIFFLISGFLISGLVAKPSFNYLAFLAHRVLRIYPAFVVSLVVFLGYAIAFDNGHFWLNGLLGNILLLNGIPGLGFPYISIVTWSLFFEFSFYIILPLLFRLATRQGQTNLWKLSSFALLLILPLLAISGSYMRYLMFLAGIWLRMLPRERLESLTNKIPEYGVIAVYVLTTTFFMFVKNWIVFIPVYILPCFALVNCTINGHGMLNRIFSLRPLRYLGNISFSFYLYHTLGLKIAASILKALSVTGFVPYAISYFLIGFSLALVLATLSFWLLERPYFSQKARLDMILRKLRLMPVTVS